MKKLMFLAIAALIFMSACKQETKNVQVAEATIIKQDSEVIKANQKWYCDSVEGCIAAKVESMFAKQAYAMVPETYELTDAITSIRLEEYKHLAELKTMANWNESLNESDSINELKLTELFNKSEFSLTGRYYKISHLWQIVHYDMYEDEDIDERLQIVAERNGMELFLNQYLVKLADAKLDNYGKIVLNSKNSNVPQWKKLRERAITTYEVLKQEAIKKDPKLAYISEQEWGRDTWRHSNGM